MRSRWTLALAAALAAACTATVTAPAAADAACGPAGYAYAGVQPAQTGHGISAVLTSLATPAVESGHVAGWVGVGGPGQGPNGADEWLQVGLNSLPGTGNTLYYEVARPGSGITYHEVSTGVVNGRSLRVAVLATAEAPGAWRIWVNGQPVTAPIDLPGSAGGLVPMAMGESWDGGKRVCNRYRYRFDRVSVAGAAGGSWQAAEHGAVLQDPGYKVVKRDAASFEALATRAPAGDAGSQPASESGTRTVAGVKATPTKRPQKPAAHAKAVAVTVPLQKGSVPAPSAATPAG